MIVRLRRSLGAFAYTKRALVLVWGTSPRLALVLGGLSLVAAVLPASIALVGKRIVDGVLLAAETGSADDQRALLLWVALEATLVTLLAATQRGLDVATSLLRAQLGHQVNLLILRKAQRMSLAQFEDTDFYDRLTRARREASSRPLSLVKRTFGIGQQLISLATFGALLLAYSPWAVLLLALSALPAFVAETRFAGEAFRIFSWRTPETRRQGYLEVLVAREDYAKEVKLLGLGDRLVDEYDGIFTGLYAEDRGLALRRGLWGWALGLVSTAALYGAYASIALAAIAGRITLGAMTMYLAVFKQGQSAFSAMLSAIGGMYEDNLYLSNLYAFLEEPEVVWSGTSTSGPSPGEGLVLRGVRFTYPGADAPALDGVDLTLRPGEKLALVGHNGSGKTTLVKLLCRLYDPDEGVITLDGRDLREWAPEALRKRVGVIFQDFQRYQFTIGENIAVGDIDRYDDEAQRWRAAEAGMAAPFIRELPAGLDTQLGRWFLDGRELSGGQWQKVALARAFMRESAQILVLDEPTSAMDAEAESEVFDRVRALAVNQMAILISHRFSTVRMADNIVVLDAGKVVEQGSHEQLIALGQRYARLFELQAQGYR